MSEDQGGLGRFLAALDKLPAYEGVTFRGLAAGESAPVTGVVTGVMASSRSPRVASENFTAPVLVALLNRTGRDLTALSRFPEEAEVVVLPGSLWRALGPVEVGGVVVHVMEELEPSGRTRQPASWGRTMPDVVDGIGRELRTAVSREPVTVNVAGKFAGRWVTEVPTG
jgi:hypothetical protein